MTNPHPLSVDPDARATASPTHALADPFACAEHAGGLWTQRANVRYHERTADLFEALGGTSAENSVLLESADIDSQKNTQCLAVLSAALRVTCCGQEVTVEALTATGRIMLARLIEQLADHLTGKATESVATFGFEMPTDPDERQRLQAPSNATVLRALQLHAGYRSTLLPFLAGGFAYDYLETFEHIGEVGPGENTYPDYQFLVAETLLSVDHTTGESFVEAVAPTREELTARLDQLSERIAADLPAMPAPAAPASASSQANARGGNEATSDAPNATPSEGLLEVRTNFSDAEFRDAVTKLQGNITAGDIYQVVPARSFRCDCPDAFLAYRHLRTTNPSPYLFYLRGAWQGRRFELFGASPESNLKFDVETRQVEVYPVAGTKPRGLHADGSINHELDIRAELSMRTDAKEVAEHAMLVDLARNDLARVAVPATRRVADLLQVDRYSRVMHLVSRIVATLDPAFDALDAYRACMNMGTLTGAPKLRATELLREVEGTRRGSYGGAVGYLRGDGSMDTAIVIRSAFVQDGTATVQAGAGVVHDSIPQSEADESLHKAYAVLHAIGLAAQRRIEVAR